MGEYERLNNLLRREQERYENLKNKKRGMIVKIIPLIVCDYLHFI